MVYTPYCEMRMDETSCLFLSFRLHFPLKEESISSDKLLFSLLEWCIIPVEKLITMCFIIAAF